MPNSSRPKNKKSQVAPPLFSGDTLLPIGLIPFDFQPRTRLVFGAGAVDRAGELARGLGGKNILLVTDPGLIAAGHAGRVQRILEKAKLHVTLYGSSRENPSTRDVADCLTVAKNSGVDMIVGLGGGSSMDTAKGCNFLLTNGGRMQDYWGINKATKPMLPLIAIPTTSGTGSECQSFALIADEKTHQKMACGDFKAAARIAILDPELTVSQPKRITAVTGIDALTHAVETAVTRKRNAISLLYSHAAFKLLVGSFSVVLEQPNDLEARGRMLLGAALAGAAIENSMLGAAHSAANPLTAHFGMVHGQAVGMMLPGVMRFNAQDKTARSGYAHLAMISGVASSGKSEKDAVTALIQKLESLLNAAGIPRSLAECGVKSSDLKKLAEEAARQWTAGFNPRAIGKRDFEKLYSAAFKKRG